MKRIYFDHNATTQVRQEVIEAMLPYFNQYFGNPSSIHSFGREAADAMEKARKDITDFFHASPDEIYFTSGGTESDNWALKGVAYANKSKGNHIITSSIEHHAVLNPCKQLEKEGFVVTYLDVDENGLVSPEDVERAITDKTILISIMMANNEVGTIQPITEIGEIIKKRSEIYFHTDAVQAVGKIPIDLERLKIDLLSLSGHKLYGPKGIGILYIRKGTRIASLLHGGHHERHRRAGTENIPGIIGLSCAIKLLAQEMEQETNRLTKLRNNLEQGILSSIDSVKLNGHPTQRLPGVTNLSFAFIEGESLVLNLDINGIACSSGSACTSDSLTASHVLSAMKVPREIIQGSIRFSLGIDNTEDDVLYCLKVLQEIVQRLRKMSPLYNRI